MSPPFFPDASFGWLYYGLLVAYCLAAVQTDVKWQRLPNFLTVQMFALGLVMNLIRSTWLGYSGEPGRYFGWSGSMGGFIEGVCFALAGFVVAFAIFVVLLILKKCGAGDVKLMAAIGTWVGPVWFFFVFTGTIVAVIPILLGWWAYAFAMKKNPGLKLSYALPAFISTSLMMLWLWRKALFI